MNKTKIALLLVIILGIGLFLRIYNLNKHDFWYDEALSLLTVRDVTPQTALNYCKISSGWDITFFTLLYLWAHLVTDDSLFRLLPLIFGILSIILIYSVGKKLFDSKTGLISAFLLAISPFHIYYSQELRSYSLVTLLSLVSIYFFIRILERERIFLWVCFIFFNILCLYSHGCAVFFLLSENTCFFLWYRKVYICLLTTENRRKLSPKAIFLSENHQKLLLRWSISQLIILLFFAVPFFILINGILNFQLLSTFAWVPRPSIQMVIHTFNIFNLGYNSTNGLYICGWAVFLPLFFLGVWNGVKEKRNVCLLLLWLFIPIIIVILISMTLKQSSMYIHRTFIYIIPAYYIIIANGLRNIKNYRFCFIVVFFIIALAIVSLRNYYNDIFPQSGNICFREVPIKKEYKPAANYIKSGFQKEDIIVHSSQSSVYPFMYYHKNEMKQQWIASGDNIDLNWSVWWGSIFKRYPYLSELNLLKPFVVVDIKKLLVNHRRIWLVYSGWDLYYRESTGVKNWFDSNLRLIKKANFKGIDIYLYGLKNNSQNNTSPKEAVNITVSGQ